MKDLLLIFIVCFLVFLIYAFPNEPGFQGFQGRKVLLQQTNYEELLKAGRELISKAEWEEYVDKYDGNRHRDLVIPENVTTPEVIQTLIEMPGLSIRGYSRTLHKGGCLPIVFGYRESGTFGVRIYPEDFNEPMSSFTSPDDIILIPGLWYFDNAYDEIPKLRKENEKLIKKNKYLKKMAH